MMFRPPGQIHGGQVFITLTRHGDRLAGAMKPRGTVPLRIAFDYMPATERLAFRYTTAHGARPGPAGGGDLAFASDSTAVPVWH